MIGWPSWWRGAAAPSVSRWVAADTETTGLDPASDALLAIGAVAIVDGAIDVADSFEVTVRQDRIRSGPDVLVHRIGVGAQREGVSLADALDAFVAFLAGAPLVGFHASFDRAVLRRGCEQTRRREPRSPWLDLAALAPALLPAHAACRSLDEWLSVCGIRCDNRHNAAADALATAQLLVRLLPEARRQGISGFEGLREAERSRRWLPGR